MDERSAVAAALLGMVAAEEEAAILKPEEGRLQKALEEQLKMKDATQAFPEDYILYHSLPTFQGCRMPGRPKKHRDEPWYARFDNNRRRKKNCR